MWLNNAVGQHGVSDLYETRGLRRLGPPVVNRDLHMNILGIRFHVLNKDIEVAVIVKSIRVDQLNFGLILARLVPRHQFVLRKPALWIFVERFQIGVRRRAVEVIVDLLDIFTMITFVSR
ncbi:hypothetical protein HG15A2_40770 [Adhaeretor mobilis]|uniref:Uncharacterized protein n=1 Tax=Adhaeretor mobilis TaxID=1930276 RepID=A0A517N0S8_9BACT|nr:hypothetical protein HG15A2_40770 [Adhaeretor mobilis]